MNRHEVAAQPEILARQHDRGAVIANRPTHDDDVAVADMAKRWPSAGQAHADSGRRQVNAAALAASHDLRVARTDTHARLDGRLGQARHDAFELLDLETLLDESVQRQVHRLRAGDREIVGRAVHGERTNVAARELERLNREAVGGDHDLAIVEIDRHSIGLHVDFAG
jgi:hypothetical protein